MEKTMDRNYYYEKMTKQRQREVSQELATRNLLKDGKREPLSAKQAKRLILRTVPAIIIFTLLLLYFIG